MPLKGYRTLLFNLVLAIGAIAGHAIAPDQAAHAVDLALMLGGAAGNIGLRLITTTPFGKAVVDSAERFIQLRPDAVEEINDAVTAAFAAHGTPLVAMPAGAPDTDLVALAQSITGMRATIEGVHAQMAGALTAAQAQVAAAMPALPNTPREQTQGAAAILQPPQPEPGPSASPPAAVVVVQP